MSPEVSRHLEMERITINLKFQFAFGLVWLRLFTGRVPINQIQYLTGLVGRLATQMEQAMSEINALSAAQISGKVSA